MTFHSFRIISRNRSWEWSVNLYHLQRKCFQAYKHWEERQEDSLCAFVQAAFTGVTQHSTLCSAGQLHSGFKAATAAGTILTFTPTPFQQAVVAALIFRVLDPRREFLSARTEGKGEADSYWYGDFCISNSDQTSVLWVLVLKHSSVCHSGAIGTNQVVTAINDF